MDFNENSFDIFLLEEQVIKDAKTIMHDFKKKDNPLYKNYKKLVKAYEKLLNDSKKIVKLSDSLQKQLSNASEEIRQQEILKKHDMQAAQRIQSKLIPERRPDFNGFSIASEYIPMNEVGGDFFDYILIDKYKTGFFIGDVSGHGVSASLVTTLIKSAIDNEKEFLANPADLLNSLQKKLLPMLDEKFFTAFYGVFNEKDMTFTYSCAGHLDQLLIKTGTDEVEKLFLKGPVIGFFDYPGFNYSETRLKVEKDDLIVLFTDGLTELFCGPKSYETQYGQNGIIKTIISNKNVKIEELVDLIINDAREHQIDKEFKDDVALIIIKIK